MSNFEIGPGKVQLVEKTDVLTIPNITIGLGIFLMGKNEKIGVGAHIVIAPSVTMMINNMLKLIDEKGLNASQLIAKMAGCSSFLNSTMENKIPEVITEKCQSLGISILGKEFGGNDARTLMMPMVSGKVRIKSPHGEKII